MPVGEGGRPAVPALDRVYHVNAAALDDKAENYLERSRCVESGDGHAGHVTNAHTGQVVSATSGRMVLKCSGRAAAETVGCKRGLAMGLPRRVPGAERSEDMKDSTLPDPRAAPAAPIPAFPVRSGARYSCDLEHRDVCEEVEWSEFEGMYSEVLKGTVALNIVPFGWYRSEEASTRAKRGMNGCRAGDSRGMSNKRIRWKSGDLAYVDYGPLRTQGPDPVQLEPDGNGSAVVTNGDASVTIVAVSDLLRRPWYNRSGLTWMETALSQRRLVARFMRLVCDGDVELSVDGGPGRVVVDQPLPAVAGCPVPRGFSVVYQDTGEWWVSTADAFNSNLCPALVSGNLIIPNSWDEWLGAGVCQQPSTLELNEVFGGADGRSLSILVELSPGPPELARPVFALLGDLIYTDGLSVQVDVSIALSMECTGHPYHVVGVTPGLTLISGEAGPGGGELADMVCNTTIRGVFLRDARLMHNAWSDTSTAARGATPHDRNVSLWLRLRPPLLFGGQTKPVDAGHPSGAVDLDALARSAPHVDGPDAIEYDKTDDLQ